MRGFTLLEVLVAFTIVVMWTAFLYLALGNTLAKIIKDDTVLKQLRMQSYILSYPSREHNFIIIEQLDFRDGEHRLTCKRMWEGAGYPELLICPYTDKAGREIPWLIRAKVEDKWLIIVR